MAAAKPALIDFPVKNRWSGEVQFTAKIVPGDVPTIQLGLAVRWAVENKANLAGANLGRAYLAGANLDGAYLGRANLDGANLAGANLDGANLAGANLDGAYLAGAYLGRANLDGANLGRAYLAGANLAGANLDGANLAGAYLGRAKIRDKTIVRLIASLYRISDPYHFLAFETEGGEVWIRAGCRWFTPGVYRAHVAAEYADTDKGAETTAILDFIDARVSALGIVAEPVTVAA